MCLHDAYGARAAPSAGGKPVASARLDFASCEMPAPGLYAKFGHFGARFGLIMSRTYFPCKPLCCSRVAAVSYPLHQGAVAQGTFTSQLVKTSCGASVPWTVCKQSMRSEREELLL